MIVLHMEAVSAFARGLDDKHEPRGIGVVDFARLIETFHDELQRAIDGDALKCQEVKDDLENRNPSFIFGPGRYEFHTLGE